MGGLVENGMVLLDQSYFSSVSAADALFEETRCNKHIPEGSDRPHVGNYGIVECHLQARNSSNQNLVAEGRMGNLSFSVCLKYYTVKVWEYKHPI